MITLPFLLVEIQDGERRGIGRRLTTEKSATEKAAPAHRVEGYGLYHSKARVSRLTALGLSITKYRGG
jgi:hypothetical protein